MKISFNLLNSNNNSQKWQEIQKSRQQSFMSYFPNNQQNVALAPASIQNSTSLDWTHELPILKAINELKNLEFNSNDIQYVKSMGVVLPFKNGKEAADFINEANVRVKFETLASPHVHAQYDYETNFVKINEIYRNTQNPAEILAISEAILHEVGHAFDKDRGNSVQEEINCLALNAVSHRAFNEKYPGVFTNADALIIKDGVCVYADLFFDNDPQKTRLLNRLRQKYGFLPAGDFTHPPSLFAMKVKEQ